MWCHIRDIQDCLQAGLQLAMHSGIWPERLLGLSEGLPAEQH